MCSRCRAVQRSRSGGVCFWRLYSCAGCGIWSPAPADGTRFRLSCASLQRSCAPQWHNISCAAHSSIGRPAGGFLSVQRRNASTPLTRRADRPMCTQPRAHRGGGAVVLCARRVHGQRHADHQPAALLDPCCTLGDGIRGCHESRHTTEPPTSVSHLHDRDKTPGFRTTQRRWFLRRCGLAEQLSLKGSRRNA